MIRWLSQRWVSGAIDRGQKPPRLWRYTFGRIASHRGFAKDMHDLDAQLRRQAVSQQRAIARDVSPVGHYPARPSANQNHRPQPATGWGVWIARPALAAGLCAVIAGTVWLAWPKQPTHSPQDVQAAFARAWEPLAKEAQSTSRAFRDRAALVTTLPEKLPAIDEVVNNLGNAIESPIREEVRRFTQDVTRPWTYLAQQLPLPQPDRTDEPAAG
jgi:hypothetical protein